MTPRVLLLLAIAAVLAGVLAWDFGQRAAKPVTPITRIMAEVLAPALERPVFNPARRPPTEALPAPGPEPTAQSFRLLGVASSDGIRVALIEIDGARARLKRGQSIAGWRLSEIEPRRAVLTKDGARRVLSF